MMGQTLEPTLHIFFLPRDSIGPQAWWDAEQKVWELVEP